MNRNNLVNMPDNLFRLISRKTIQSSGVLQGINKSAKKWQELLSENRKEHQAILNEIEYIRSLQSLEISRLIETDPTFRADADGNCIYASDEWCENFGWTLDQVSDLKWSKIIHPHDAPAMIEEYMESLRSQRPYVGEYRIRTSSGKYKAAMTVSRPIEMAGIYAGAVGITIPV